MKTLQSLHTKSLVEEEKRMKEAKATPKPSPKQQPDQDVDVDHTKAQEAVDKLVAKQMEQKREQTKRENAAKERRKTANKRKQAGPKEMVSPKRKRSSPPAKDTSEMDMEGDYEPHSTPNSPPQSHALPPRGKSSRSRKSTSNASVSDELGVGAYIELDVEGKNENGVIMATYMSDDGAVLVDLELDDGRQIFKQKITS
ncbi:hypothetical protein TL16_g12890 [Triparma laevis f. inornata]|uniref:Uncharacterized protein n=1 Tax=Triparma laevis f. inornata TaxID=1714386 RepID=A0A9W7BN88_9STRA|nr:hypothetical protein TL16_g12890 [Triparma laevis f. inornata]